MEKKKLTRRKFPPPPISLKDVEASGTYVRIPRAILNLPAELKLLPVDRMILVALLSHLHNNTDKKMWPSMKTIAKKIGASARTVQDATKRLESAELITRRRKRTYRYNVTRRLLDFTPPPEKSSARASDQSEESSGQTGKNLRCQPEESSGKYEETEYEERTTTGVVVSSCSFSGDEGGFPDEALRDEARRIDAVLKEANHRTPDNELLDRPDFWNELRQNRWTDPDVVRTALANVEKKGLESEAKSDPLRGPARYVLTVLRKSRGRPELNLTEDEREELDSRRSRWVREQLAQERERKRLEREREEAARPPFWADDPELAGYIEEFDRVMRERFEGAKFRYDDAKLFCGGKKRLSDKGIGLDDRDGLIVAMADAIADAEFRPANYRSRIPDPLGMVIDAVKGRGEG